jgi:hypothetical protein
MSFGLAQHEGLEPHTAAIQKPEAHMPQKLNAGSAIICRLRPAPRPTRNTRTIDASLLHLNSERLDLHSPDVPNILGTPFCTFHILGCKSLCWTRLVSATAMVIACGGYDPRCIVFAVPSEHSAPATARWARIHVDSGVIVLYVGWVNQQFVARIFDGEEHEE